MEQNDLQNLLKKALNFLTEKNERPKNIKYVLEDTRIWVDSIVCPECAFELDLKDTNAKPCEHLAAMMEDWQSV